MDIKELNHICKGSFVDLLHIEFTSYTDRTVEADMRIEPDLFQPMGIVHGGALISLAETVASAGSFLLTDPEHYDVYGAAVNSQHMAPAREGVLRAVATLTVKGDFKHVWDVEIKDRRGKLISISRVTTSVKPKSPEA